MKGLPPRNLANIFSELDPDLEFVVLAHSGERLARRVDLVIELGAGEAGDFVDVAGQP